MLERNLDLGTGYGGDYMEKDTVTRVGLDLREDRLIFAAGKYNVEPVVADAQQGLPFETGSFQSVQCILPTDELLVALTDFQGKLWSEIHRVLTANGRALVIFEKPTNGNRKVIQQNLPVEVDPVLMGDVAAKQGFNVRLRELNPCVVERIGTPTADALLEQEPNDNFYIVIAKKS